MIFFGVTFFSLYGYFGLSGGAIDFQDASSTVKFIGTAFLLPIGLYGGLYFAAGKKVALQIGGGLALLLIIAFLIGFFLHH